VWVLRNHHPHPCPPPLVFLTEVSASSARQSSSAHQSRERYFPARRETSLRGPSTCPSCFSQSNYRPIREQQVAVVIEVSRFWHGDETPVAQFLRVKLTGAHAHRPALRSTSLRVPSPESRMAAASRFDGSLTHTPRTPLRSGRDRGVWLYENCCWPPGRINLLGFTVSQYT
jgi:hypothetical protein